MPIQITARRDGFRRAGISHGESSTEYPDDYFTAKQLAELRAEPMLIVVSVTDTPQAKGDAEALVKAQARIAELEAGMLQMSADAEAYQQELNDANATIARLTPAQDDGKASKK